MRAWQVHTLGKPDDVLSLDDVAEPEPGPGELLVRVDAAALNFPDILLCRGKYQERPPLPFTPGLEICRRLGAEVAIDYLAEDFADAVKAATDGRGADVIYDSVGGDTFDRSRKCIAFEGRIVVVGFAGGRIADAPTNHLLLKNYAVVGLHWGLYRQFEPGLFAQIHAELMDLHARGAIDPLVYAELPLVEAPAALRRLAERGTWGKVVLRP